MNVALTDKLFLDGTLSFGGIVRAHRLSMHLTQCQVAKHLGCAQATISLIETDKCLPSLSTLIGLMLALDIDPHEILMEP